MVTLIDLHIFTVDFLGYLKCPVVIQGESHLRNYYGNIWLHMVTVSHMVTLGYI